MTAEGDQVPSGSRWNWRPVVGIGVLLVVAVLFTARFLTADDPAAAGPTARAVTLSAQVVELEERVERAPSDLASWQALGVLYVRRANESADPSFYALAERALDEADALAPNDPLTLIGRGNLALALHDFELAREFGALAHAELPSSGDALAVLVDAEVELGDYEAAVRRTEQLLELRPDVAALSRVSYLRELHGDIPGAITAMNSAGAAADGGSAFDRATVSALVGDLLLDTGDTTGAAAAYASALEVSPGLVPAEVGLARIEAAGDDTEAAIERLERVVAGQPRPDALSLLGDLRRRAGDEGAAADADELVRTVARLQESSGQSVDLELALFEADRGDDPQRALELAEASHDARPDNVFAADVLAWALHRAGKSEEAVEHVEHALRLGTQDPLLRFHAAVIHAAAGRDDVAREHLQAVAAANPWFSFSHLDAAGQLADQLGIERPDAWVAR